MQLNFLEQLFSNLPVSQALDTPKWSLGKSCWHTHGVLESSRVQVDALSGVALSRGQPWGF